MIGVVSEMTCYVYWVKSPDMGDLFSQGYVGISYSPEIRFKQHKSNALTNSHHQYKDEFRESLLSGSCELKILISSTREYCLDLERKIRPELSVGWNSAIGGDGGNRFKHGLTDSRLSKTYYNLINRAFETNEVFWDGWLGEGGLVEFSKFYKEFESVEGNFTLREKGKGYNPENIIKIKRSEIINKAYRKYDIGDGGFYSVNELGIKFNLKPNTISSRMRDGWTVRQAVGLDYRKPKRRKYE